jgi:hypothetical protein
MILTIFNFWAEIQVMKATIKLLWHKKLWCTVAKHMGRPSSVQYASGIHSSVLVEIHFREDLELWINEAKKCLPIFNKSVQKSEY